MSGHVRRETSMESAAGAPGDHYTGTAHFYPGNPPHPSLTTYQPGVFSLFTFFYFEPLFNLSADYDMTRPHDTTPSAESTN